MMHFQLTLRHRPGQPRAIGAYGYFVEFTEDVPHDGSLLHRHTRRHGEYGNANGSGSLDAASAPDLVVGCGCVLLIVGAEEHQPYALFALEQQPDRQPPPASHLQ